MFAHSSKLLFSCFLYTCLLGWMLPSAWGQETKPVALATAIIQAAKQNLPAVVYIEVTESKEVVNPHLPLENNPFFRRFFGIPKMPKKFKQEMKGLGSGMILDAEGHILTNFHVAGGATKLEVGLADGSKYPAKLVGGDPKTDLAVIKVSAKERLPHITFGDSDKMEVGEWVVAIGAPQALEKSVTHGVISAKHREGVTDPANYQDFLQTDAAINPGNSGGPLLNLHGEVIGVNTAIATESGGFEGIGFTIPSNMARYVAKALIAHGEVNHFNMAMDYFLKNDVKGAASEIRNGIADLKSEAEHATEEIKEILKASIDELEKLANEVEKGLVTSAKRMEEAFESAHRVSSSRR
jgi:S1-C subfamily serine protease